MSTTFEHLIIFRRRLEEAERLAHVFAEYLQNLTPTELRKLTLKRKRQGLPRLTRQQIFVKLTLANQRNFDGLREMIEALIEDIKTLPSTYLPFREPQLALIESVKDVPSEAEIFFAKSEELTKFITDGIVNTKQKAKSVMATIKIAFMRDNQKKIRTIRTKAYSVKGDPFMIANQLIDTGYEGGDIISFHLHFLTTGNERIVRLADYKIENCLINVLRLNTSDEKIDKLYKKFPELVPADGNKVYVTEAQIMQIARFANVKFRIYTPLGFKMQQPWCEYGGKNYKQINIIIENEHATVIPSNRIDDIVYVDSPVIVPDSPKVFYKSRSEVGNYIDGEIIITNFYIMKENNKTTLYKAFRPSAITNNPEDDQNPNYFYYYRPDQVLASLFCQENKIYPVKDNTTRQIILNAERFIGRAKLSPIPTNAIALDHNRHYSSAEFNPFYIGYPEDTLVISNDLQSAAYIIGTLTNAPEEYKVFFSEQEKVFTRPEYDYLISRGSTITIEYTLNAPMRKISIYEWCENRDLYGAQEKLFVNDLIGKLITGGIKQTEPIMIQFANSSERDRLITECADRNLPFKIIFYDQQTDENETNMIEEETDFYQLTEAQMCPRGHIRVAIPNKKSSGKFNFHAYLMGYASIAMYIKLRKLTDDNYTLHAYNVDCLIVSPNKDSPKLTSKTQKNQWKIERIKDHYHQYTPKTHMAHLDLPIIVPPTRRIHTKHTAIIAPAGLGKSYEHLTDPAVNQVYTTPTHDLKNEITRLYPNIKVHTAHKIFQFTVKDDKTWLGMIKKGVIPSPGSILVLDELTMYDQTQIRLIIRRANLTNTIVVALGDFCQITQNINGAAITEDFIEQYFEIETRIRTPESHARHEYTYGLELDNLRYESHKFQLHWLTTRDIHGAGSISIEDIVANYIETSTRVIVGNHARANIYHQSIKQQHPDKQILCRYKDKKLTLEKLISIQDPLIWWDKQKMADQMPTDKKYEPHFAATVDSFQGKTQQVIIDPKGMNRPGVLYTAITRSPTRPWWVYEHLAATQNTDIEPTITDGDFDDQ